MSYKWLTNKFIISSFFILIIFLIGLFSLVNIAEKKLSNEEFLEQIINQNTELVAKIDNPKIKFSFLAVNIRTNSFALFEKEKETPFFKVDSPYIKINLLPFIWKKASIPYVLADNVQVYLNRLEDGTFDIEKYFIKKESPFTPSLASTTVYIKDYDIQVNDIRSKNKFLIDGKHIKSSGLDVQKKFSLSTGGDFIILNSDGKNNSAYLIDIDYTKTKKTLKLKKQEIALSSFNPSFLKNYFPNLKFKNFDAKFDIYSGLQEDGNYKLTLYADKLNLDFNYKDERNTIIADNPVISETVFNFKGDDLLIDKGDFWSEGAHILYSGKVNNILDTKKIGADIKITLDNIDAGKLLKILPDTVIPMQEPYIQNSKKYNANGLVNGSMNINYKNQNDYSVLGKLDFEDVYVVQRPKNAKTSFGSCEFTGHDVLINVYANAPNDTFLTVFGKSKLQLNPDSEFDIQSHGKLDLAFAHSVLIPVKEILGLKLGPVPNMTFKGHGEITLKTAGNKDKAKLYGKFTTDDATVTLNNLNTVMTNGRAEIVFDENKIIYDGIKGIIEGAKTEIDGKADTDGNLSVIVNVYDAPAKNAMKIAQTSKIVASALDGGEFLNSFKPESGNIDFYLKLYGNVPPDAEFGERCDTLLAEGKIKFKGNSLTITPNIKGKNIKGSLDFSNGTNFDLTADIFDSPFKITGKVFQKGAKNGIIHGVPSNIEIRFISDELKSASIGKFILDDLELFVPQNRMFAKNLAQIFAANKFVAKGDVSASGLVYSNATTLDLSGFNFNGFINPINKKDNDFVFKSGNITLKNKMAKFNNLRVLASKVDFCIDGYIDKFTSLKPFNSLKITFFPSSLDSYVNLFSKMLPEKQKKTLSSYGAYSGSLSGWLKLYSDKVDGEFIPSKISFLDKKSNSLVSLKDGKIKFKNDKLIAKSLNILYGPMPLFVDGYIQIDGRENPEFNLFASTNLTEEACDKVINPSLQYPLFLSGEMALKGRIQGKTNAYTTYLTAVLNEGSDIEFMGVRLGDVASKREFSSKIRFNGSNADIDYARYFKYVPTTAGKTTPQDIIKLSGGIKLKNNDIVFNNFKFQTPNPAPARFVNLLFRRSIAKKGTFTSNLTLNGPSSDFKAHGNILFSKVFIPLYGSVIEDINITLNQNTGDASFKFAIYNTVIDVVANFENKVTLPLVINNLNIHSASISADNFVKALTSLSDTSTKISNTPHAVQSAQTTLSASDLQIKKGLLNVDKLDFNGVEANDLKLHFSYSPKDSSLIIDDSYMGIAGGLFKGNGKYKFDTSDIALSSNFINCDANLLTQAFFNLSGEIFGNANGNFKLSLKDFNSTDYIKKINATADFEISQGRMPKLGSIEYLLRASNLIRSGIFGLTLNSVIEVLKPYRQGNFNKISGSLVINDAMIKDLKIYSQGDELSTYTSGTFDIVNSVSNIEILGKLSKKISNLLGPIGNTSVSSILNAVTRNKADELARSELANNINKIPLINLQNSDEYRLFRVLLQGEIYKNSAVKSFNWLN